MFKLSNMTSLKIYINNSSMYNSFVSALHINKDFPCMAIHIVLFSFSRVLLIYQTTEFKPKRIQK